MATVYSLWYRHGDRIGGAHSMVVGTYSSEANAKAAMMFLSDKPGFRDYGIEGFAIESRKIDVTPMPHGPVGTEGTLSGNRYYNLWHRSEDERGYDHDRPIGTYSSQAKAEHALSMIRELPEFHDLPEEALEIAEGTIDNTYMQEGFVTVYPGEEF